MPLRTATLLLRNGTPAAFALAFAIAGYVLVAAGAHAGASSAIDPTPWNGAPAILLLLAATLGARAAGPVLLAVAAGEALSRGTGGAWAAFVVGSCGVAACYLAAGVAIGRSGRMPADEPTLSDLSRLLVLSAVAALAAACTWVGVHAAGHALDAAASLALLTRTWIGDLCGIATTLPLLMLLAGGHLRDWNAGERGPRQALKDYGAFVATLVPLLGIVFGLRPFDEFRTSYLLFLPMIGIALRHGLAGAAIVVPVVEAGLLASLALSRTRSASAYEYQLLMLTLAVGGLCLGTLATERARAVRALARRDAELREREMQTNQALRAAAASEMASSLAHELNQPLSAIGTYARACHEMMADPVRNRARLGETLDKVARESGRAGDIVRRMRDFFRSGALKLEAIAVADLAGQARDQVDDRCRRAGIDLQLQIAPGLPALTVDPVQMRIVLANLLNNSIDALRGSTAPRSIVLRARGAGDAAVRIDVEDSGPGVALEVREHLFEPRATSKPDGMGLGLAIARGIVVGHGGSLWLDPTAPRTTFSVQLPCHG